MYDRFIYNRVKASTSDSLAFWPVSVWLGNLVPFQMSMSFPSKPLTWIRLFHFLFQTIRFKLKITNLSQLELLYQEDRKRLSLLLSSVSSHLALKLHGICKEDPLSAPIFCGAVTKRCEFSGQAAEAPVKPAPRLTVWLTWGGKTAPKLLTSPQPPKAMT